MCSNHKKSFNSFCVKLKKIYVYKNTFVRVAATNIKNKRGCKKIPPTEKSPGREV